MMDLSGKFIVLEGGDGVGKTTQARMLADRLKENGESVLFTREPGGCPEAEAIRSILFPDYRWLSHYGLSWTPATEVLLHTAARIEHVRKTIGPALDRGECVICDRYHWSTIAYQCAGNGIPTSLVSALREQVPLLCPDIVIVIDAPVDVLGNRITFRGSGNRYDGESKPFRERVRQSFLDQHRFSPWYSAVINGDQDERSVHRDVINELTKWKER